MSRSGFPGNIGLSKETVRMIGITASTYCFGRPGFIPKAVGLAGFVASAAIDSSGHKPGHADGYRLLGLASSVYLMNRPGFMAKSMGVTGFAATTLYDAYQLGVEHSDVVDHKISRAKLHLKKLARSSDDYREINEVLDSTIACGMFNVETGMQQRWGLEFDTAEVLSMFSNLNSP